MTDTPAQHSQKGHYFGLVLGLMAGTCWGTTSVATRYLHHIRHVPPPVSVFWRFTLAFPLLVLATRMWEDNKRKFEWKDLPLLFALSAVGTFLMSDMSFAATKFTTNVNTTVIMTASAVIIGIIAILMGDSVTGNQWLGIWAGLAGVVFIAFAKNPGEEGLTFLKHATGVGCAVLGSISWAVYTYFGKGIVHKYGGLRVTAWAIGIGALLQIPLALCYGLADTIGAFTVAEWLVVLYIGLVPTAVAFALWFVALHYIDATTLGMTQYTGPILNAFLGWLVLREPVLWQHIAGTALVFVGLHFAARPPAPPHEQEPVAI